MEGEEDYLHLAEGRRQRDHQRPYQWVPLAKRRLERIAQHHTHQLPRNSHRICSSRIALRCHAFMLLLAASGSSYGLVPINKTLSSRYRMITITSLSCLMLSFASIARDQPALLLSNLIERTYIRYQNSFPQNLRLTCLTALNGPSRIQAPATARVMTPRTMRRRTTDVYRPI